LEFLQSKSIVEAIVEAIVEEIYVQGLEI